MSGLRSTHKKRFVEVLVIQGVIIIKLEIDLDLDLAFSRSKHLVEYTGCLGGV